MDSYEGTDAATVAALRATEEELLSAAGPRLSVHEDAAALTRAMADRLFEDIAGCLASRGRCTLIVPVGPVGQYQLLAKRCIDERMSLDRVTLIVMDEYLTVDNRWIDESDPLSFRSHIQRNLVALLPPDFRPRLVVPDPLALDEIPRIVRRQGVDFSYAGVGITGHLAFNDPVTGCTDPDFIAALPTRVVRLSEQTRLINSVTAARGNLLRIPRMAVTVGMKEILAAGKLRVWMNRPWQGAAIRRMLLGPQTADFPASLVQRHGDFTVDATREVLARPEPELR
ncbi:glucosamine-6-phosphate isomerase [Oricola thermophila]|uniref:Glucosamine-6-phosphate isomerase n=1 Tax=Oricola thermophila TaxID=2742145 RepID=A0A6N1VLI4_9HYPH|nr:glucosamine-6-phosphate isomerase [Oricola thermophila]QKV20069.1 glucosamine-6-phosphate isomerase [Oricola thermophila]